MDDLFSQNVPPQAISGYALVALERGLDPGSGGLTYAVPQELADLRVGERVMVPLGRNNKKVAGYVIERMESTDYHKVKPILDRDTHSISMTADLIQLAQWMAGYYCAPLGMVFSNMLPAAVKKGTGEVNQTWVRIPAETNPADDATDQPVSGAESNDSTSGATDAQPGKKKKSQLSKLQKAALEIAGERAAQNDPLIELKELADLAGAKTVQPIRQLIKKGLLVTERKKTVRASDAMDLYESGPTDEPRMRLELNSDQHGAVDHLIARMRNGFSVHLLHGVTGSGKTEVYLRVIESMHHHTVVTDKPTELSRTAPPGIIVLVPEIALTPQTTRRFHERFENVAVLHSGLTAAQRHEQWQRIQRGEATIVVGARSAIFAPIRNIKLIIVDEEHDSSYKQDQLPRYHGRDVAIKRAQLLGIPVVLGSATPSLESYYNATHRSADINGPPTTDGHTQKNHTLPQDATADQKQSDSKSHTQQPAAANVLSKSHYHLVRLPLRVTGLKLPRVDIVDMTQERKKRYQMTGKVGHHLLSLQLEGLLRQTLKDGGQAMLLLNRRGYANYIACPDQNCGWIKQCEYCDVTMVYHKNDRLPTGGVIRCHHCGAEQLLPPTCPDCGKKVTVFGLGTQKVEEEIARLLPNITLARMDSDAMRTAADYHTTLERFRHGELQVIVGTQMIAKGLDFPNVRLVGVISADTALNLPDFRASERTFQLIAQVAGRAGRGIEPGRVIVQTFNPDDPAINFAAKHDYDNFARQELQLRAAVGLPPIARMARIVVRDRDLVRCTEMVNQLAGHLRAFNAQLANHVSLRGPAPCPIARIAEYHRQQIELLAQPPDAAAKLQKLMTALRNAKVLKSDIHMAVDVDPVALM